MRRNGRRTRWHRGFLGALNQSSMWPSSGGVDGSPGGLGGYVVYCRKRVQVALDGVGHEQIGRHVSGVRLSAELTMDRLGEPYCSRYSRFVGDSRPCHRGDATDYLRQSGGYCARLRASIDLWHRLVARFNRSDFRAMLGHAFEDPLRSSSLEPSRRKRQ